MGRILIFAVLAFVSACGGAETGENRSGTGGTDGAGGTGGDNPASFREGGMEFQSAEQILAETCGTAGCHDDSPNQSGLDLLSPDVASRVVGIAATGKGCTDRTLVVAGDLDGSYLLDKVLNAPDICFNQMPVVGSLTNEEIEVLRRWIVDIGD